MELISSYKLSANARIARMCATYSCEDLLALELVQLSGRLLEVKPRLVAGPGHVCAVVRCRQSADEKVGASRVTSRDYASGQSWPTRVNHLGIFRRQRASPPRFFILVALCIFFFFS
jgi:hypothetical protein